MTINAAQQFIQRIETDQTLRDTLADLNRSRIEAILAVAAKAGYEFTAEEYLVASVQNWVDTPVELPEPDLEYVAGGAASSTWAASSACSTMGNNRECRVSVDGVITT